MGKKALVTGVTGQDGAYLTALLLSKGYEVHGLVRPSSTKSTERLSAYLDKITLHYGDLSDGGVITRLLQNIQPDEIYNLAAQSHVHISFDMAEYTGNVDGLGVTRLLEAIRSLNLIDKVKFYQASTSELFGKTQISPQNENTPFAPCSPYAAAKLYAYWMVRNYRDTYGLFACNGILFNHESPLRGENFVTRKVTQFAADIARGQKKTLALGNLEARRDWGHAEDFVRGMWLMLQADEADDYVLATGQTHTVRYLVETAFKQIDISIDWIGAALDEKGVNSRTGETLIEISKDHFRPAEVDLLRGDSSKARQKLGWEKKYDFETLIKEMVEADLGREITPEETRVNLRAV